MAYHAHPTVARLDHEIAKALGKFETPTHPASTPGSVEALLERRFRLQRLGYAVQAAGLHVKGLLTRRLQEEASKGGPRPGRKGWSAEFGPWRASSQSMATQPAINKEALAAFLVSRGIDPDECYAACVSAVQFGVGTRVTYKGPAPAGYSFDAVPYVYIRFGEDSEAGPVDGTVVSGCPVSDAELLGVYLEFGDLDPSDFSPGGILAGMDPLETAKQEWAENADFRAHVERVTTPA